MAPMPVALSSARMPLPARPTTGDDVTIPIDPTPFWITEIPVAAPVTAPVGTIPRFDGLACVPPLAARSMPSPVLVVTFAPPTIPTAPLAIAIAVTVLVMADDPSARLPPVPVNSAMNGGEPASETVAPALATITDWLATALEFPIVSTIRAR